MPESDGTLEWDSTILVLVEIEAGNKTGLGFSYADSATAKLISDKLAGVILGASALAVEGCWNSMTGAIRNLGGPGICSMAIAAVDNALWNLKARLLDLPLVFVLCQAFNLPLSSHCAPSIHAHPSCAAIQARHLEYFYDHIRIEKMLFDGVLEPHDGLITPDLTRSGFGLEFKRKDAARYAI